VSVGRLSRITTPGTLPSMIHFGSADIADCVLT
jgi:hypothetical protein